LEADGLTAFDYLTGAAGVPPGQVIVHGQSLGSFIAGGVAARRPTGGAVLESSATTTEEWVDASHRGIARMLVRVEIDPSLRGRGNLSNMAAIDEPLLILVGAADRTTPPRLSQALYAASPLPAERKTLAVIPRANHVDVMDRPERSAPIAPGWRGSAIEPRSGVRRLVVSGGALGEDLAAVFGDADRMFELGGKRAVAGDGGPAVLEDLGRRLADVDHRLDREEHAGLQLRTGPRLGGMDHLRASWKARPRPWPQKSRTTE
jgi:hypothetical protein